MKRLIAVFVAFFLLSIPLSVPLEAAASDWTGVVRVLRASTIPITCDLHDQVTCSAFSINQQGGIYLSAAHCTDPLTDVNGNIAERPTLGGKPLKVLYKNNLLDIAILQADLKRPALYPRRQSIQPGLAVGSFGYGYGMKDAPIFRTAHVSAIVKFINPNTITIVLDNGLIRGMSGGPIADDMGKVISVNRATDGVSGNGAALSDIITYTRNYWEIN